MMHPGCRSHRGVPLLMLLLGLGLSACSGPLVPGRSGPAGDAAHTDDARTVLRANDGWAAAEGGTTGGAAALPEHVFDVHDRAQLAAALQPGPHPRIVKIHGRIDLSVDDAGKPLGYDDYRDPGFDFEAFVREFDPATWGKKPPAGPLESARKRSAANQAARVVLRVPSRTTLIGVGHDAAIVNGMLLLERVDNVIVRQLNFEDAYDHFPAWDPNDNASGEWNSEYDNLSLREARHVWIDNCTFSDGARPDSLARVALGRRMQHHDGLLDITRQSDLITVSWNHFKQHDKTMLIGSGDAVSADAGRLRVTLHHNLWQDVKERTPRVRWGQVHVYNNLFVGRDDGHYRYGYSIGVGLNSRVFSENNVWLTSPGIASTALVRLLRGDRFFDRGSLHNGQPVDLLAALRTAYPGAVVGGEPGWVPLHQGRIDPATEVAQRVRADAGVRRE